MTFVAVGDQPTGKTGKGNGGGGETGGPNARASRARARETSIVARARSVTERARARVVDTPDDGDRRTFWQHGIPAPADVVTYTRAGEWVPGEQAPWLERLGKVYGYGIALPVTCLLLGVAWVVQRPSRAGIALVIGVLLYLAWPAAAAGVTG